MHWTTKYIIQNLFVICEEKNQDNSGGNISVIPLSFYLRDKSTYDYRYIE